MTVLQSDFVETIDAVELPEGDLVPGVLRTIGDAPPTGQRRFLRWMPTGLRFEKPPLAIAIAAVVALGLVVVVLQPARSAVADWLGIGATGIEPLPKTDNLGQPATTLEASASQLGETIPDAIAQPIPRLGAPIEILDDGAAGDRRRSFAWTTNDEFPELGDSGFGVVLTIRSTSGQLDWKSVGAEVEVESVDVVFGGQTTTGLWIPGSHHLLRPQRLPVQAERVLLWVGPQGQVQYRLETNASKEAVLALAQDVDSTLSLLPPE